MMGPAQEGAVVSLDPPDRQIGEEPAWESFLDILEDSYTPYVGPFQSFPWTQSLPHGEDRGLTPPLTLSLGAPLVCASLADARPLSEKTCPICNKTFTRKVSVAIHMVVHTNLKPYACDFPGCKKKFNVKGNLQRHTKSHHLHGHSRLQTGPPAAAPSSTNRVAAGPRHSP
ncbi:ADL052C-Ap [Eremothecium gossypii ATCC 10895]|uniref:ADL052C-Ap n=1 Tax=Eremothecium gossypii (strain ATCC 10895 / CBS 109.51 / FGSC 9923 / NRRL Y-1056) TaxID=284811 RepID=D8FGC0_EREGS|nr:ADL052C-Ap [Eremothecium gossypii ATCC 10895]ADJ41763.1 ADL052C-Ap [Eremothecium gossypii ATCC 10895]AEY96166.1 FADL052C-Ap [Eremothecium gossypii FDAG1]